jgi:hypothetical protein
MAEKRNTQDGMKQAILNTISDNICIQEINWHDLSFHSDIQEMTVRYIVIPKPKEDTAFEDAMSIVK